MIRLASTTALLLAVGTAAAVPRAEARAAPSSTPAERSQTFVIEGDAALERGEHETAIDKYRAAYYGLPASQQTSYLGSIPVRNAMRAYDRLYAEAPSRVVLEQQLAFLADFLGRVEGDEGRVASIGETVVADLESKRREIERELARLAEAEMPAKPPATQPGEPELEAEETPEGDDGLAGPKPLPAEHEGTTSTAPGRPPCNCIGVGLTAAGGSLMAAGLSVGFFGLGTRISARKLVDEVNPTEEERADYLEDQDKNARNIVIVGSVILGAGVATLTAGVVHIVVRRRRSASEAKLTLVPRLGANGAGLALGGRF